jgi:hypothetical protein
MTRLSNNVVLALIESLPVDQRPWTPFTREPMPSLTKVELQQKARAWGCTYAEIKAAYRRGAQDEFWHNSRYNVVIDRAPPTVEGCAAMIQLSITRKDRAPAHDWRDFQRCKNELIGIDHEAVELYPREARVVDTANTYHLFVFADPARTFAFGWTDGLKSSFSGAGAVQRPLD